MGHSRASDNLFAYNVAVSSLARSFFIFTRGDGRYGPVYRTSVYNNVAYLTGSDSWGLYCSACSPSILSAKNNIMVANTAGYSEGSFDESHNIYWRAGGSPKVRLTMASSSLKVDPMFQNPAAGDFRLRSGSPAIDSASNAAINLGISADLNGVAIPQGSGPDRGSHEFASGTPTPPPPPTPPPATQATTHVTDHFGRTVANSWGAAEKGGGYQEFTSNASMSVQNGAGHVVLQQGAARAAAFLGVTVRDVDMRFEVKLPNRPSGDSVYAYAVTRRNGPNSYRTSIVIQPNGTVKLQNILTNQQGEFTLGSAFTIPGTYAAGADINVRVQVTGTNPTTVRAKAWFTGQGEPTGWQVVSTDSAALVQVAGGVGLRAYAGSRMSSAPLTMRFDDLRVVDP
jgi:hypothetical protein